MLPRAPFAIVLAALVGAFAMAPAQAQDAFVGMQIQALSPAVAEAMGMKRMHGVLVRDVALGGPSDEAGVRRGDLIVGFAGSDIDGLEQLVAAARRLAPGDTVKLQVMRLGERLELTMQAGAWPEGWRITKSAFAAIPAIGLTLASLTETLRKQLGLR